MNNRSARAAKKKKKTAPPPNTNTTTCNVEPSPLSNNSIRTPEKPELFPAILETDREYTASISSQARAASSLTPCQSKLWLHRFAANAASKSSCCFPASIGRLLGTITRTLEVVEEEEERTCTSTCIVEEEEKHKRKGKNKKRGPFSFQMSHPPVISSRGKKKQVKMSVATARREANLESERGLILDRGLDLDLNLNPDLPIASAVDHVSKRAEEIMKEWGEELHKTAHVTNNNNNGGGWDKHGSVPVKHVSSDADSYIPVFNLVEWMQHHHHHHAADDSNHNNNHNNNHNDSYYTIRDPMEGQYVSLYQDATRIPTDTFSVLQACVSLSDPCDLLWNTPLLICYPLVTLESETTTTILKSNATNRRQEEEEEEPPQKKTKMDKQASPSSTTTTSPSPTTTVRRVYKIHMGVYAHRLLPEAMTIRELQIVMSALDAASYKLTQPLQMPTLSNTNNTNNKQQHVFESSPYPIVCFRDEELQTTTTTMTTTSQVEDGVSAASITVTVGEPFILLGGEEGTSRDEDRISAFTPQGLLKLLENKGCSCDITAKWETTIQSKINNTFQLKLMLHQQHAICWMLEMESLGGFGINSLFWEEREFWDGGKYYFAPALGQLRLDKPPQMWGGLLCDEMGMGKTIEVLGLILATLADQKKKADQDPRHKRTHATLIIVPPALAAQWQNEIVKVTGGDALTVDFLDFQTAKVHRRGSSSSSSSRGGEADIVLTTYNALDNPAASKVLASKIWGRIVLDEMQEIRSSTTKIAKTCEQLKCDCRWMLSGTPLFEGINDLRGELNFLRLAPFGAKTEDGFFNFCITKPWQEHDTHAIDMLKVLSLVLLRRSKSMTIRDTGMPILGLKPLTVEFVAVPQSVPERALYYFLESIVARELRSNDLGGVQERKSRTACLRLLREMCTSAILLNGGMGVHTQLKTLNDILINQARRAQATLDGRDEDYDEENSSDNVMADESRVLSCDEAIMHLAQLQEATRAGDDEVAFLQLGFGQGVARRARAIDSVDQQIADSEQAQKKAREDLSAAMTSKSRALWHLALERITMGMIPSSELSSVSPKFRSLWQWRLLLHSFRYGVDDKMDQEREVSVPPPSLLSRSLQSWIQVRSNPIQLAPSKLPILLSRGWRPSAIFVRSLPIQHPDYFWAHPNSFTLESIPNELSLKEIQNAIENVLEDHFDRGESLRLALQGFHLKKVSECPLTPHSWTAGLYFHGNDEATATILQKAGHVNGIETPDAQKVPRVVESIKIAEEKLESAQAADAVHPTSMSRQALSKAKKQLGRAKLGLKIVRPNHAFVAGNIVMANAHTPSRALERRSCVFESLQESIDYSTVNIAVGKENVSRELEKAQHLRIVSERGISEEVQAMSAFDSLQALADGKQEKTRCPICLDYLGYGGKPKSGPGTIAMTKCGHLYCMDCLLDSVKHQHPHHSKQCPSCRKEFDIKSDVVHVDPQKKEDDGNVRERRDEAKRIVKDAYRLLEASNGQLDPHMWEQLYRSIDVPQGVDRSLDVRVSVLPRDFLAHLRACTEMPVHCNPSDKPSSLHSGSSCLSSKIKAFLRDLPGDERSVVFTSSRNTIKHLEVVFSQSGIGHRSLFSGQAVTSSEHAVIDWQSSGSDGGLPEIPYPVLIVQSGAAASGLTLTAACKMFMLEPFVRYEEEKQAYARIHRMGQKHECHCKIYYSPVSIESRLLEWRKLAVSDGASTTAKLSSNQDPSFVYSSTIIEEEPDMDEPVLYEDNGEEPRTQTDFLLGLHNKTDDESEESSEA